MDESSDLCSACFIHMETVGRARLHAAAGENLIVFPRARIPTLELL
jgi:hypothetical protein